MELYEKPVAELIDFRADENIMDLELQLTPGSEGLEDW